jgi:hypothetical protein
MSYQRALEAAGARILRFQYFGSYQGDWFALVEYNNKKQVIHGYFGSCTICDAFQAEFGYEDEDEEKLKEFGQGYLEHPIDLEDYIEKFTLQSEWDMDALEIVDFLKLLKREHTL